MSLLPGFREKNRLSVNILHLKIGIFFLINAKIWERRMIGPILNKIATFIWMAKSNPLRKIAWKKLGSSLIAKDLIRPQHSKAPLKNLTWIYNRRTMISEHLLLISLTNSWIIKLLLLIQVKELKIFRNFESWMTQKPISMDMNHQLNQRVGLQIGVLGEIQIGNGKWGVS